MRISDWSSDVCSSDLHRLDIEQAEPLDLGGRPLDPQRIGDQASKHLVTAAQPDDHPAAPVVRPDVDVPALGAQRGHVGDRRLRSGQYRSEEHTSELQSLMRISYAVFCLKKKTTKKSLSSNYLRSNNNSYTYFLY